MSIHFETPKTSARVEKYDNRLLFSRWFLGPFMQKKMENSCISKSTTQSLQAQKAKSTSARHCTSIVNPYTFTWNPKQPDFCTVVSIGWWTKPLLGKWLFHHFHPFKKWVFFRLSGTWYQKCNKVTMKSYSGDQRCEPSSREPTGSRRGKDSQSFCNFSLPYPIFPQPFGGWKFLQMA